MITEVTRRAIFDVLTVEGIRWSGHLDEPEFLSRLFDLKALPSYDGRFSDATGDIWKHRVMNRDWDDTWVFSDRRFDLLRGDDEVFLRFLCETIHPVVRTDAQEVEHLRHLYNEHLRKDGFEIVEKSRISERPVFSARRIALPGASALKAARETFSPFDGSQLYQQITRMEAAVEDDPGLAIGTAKELVETCCKTILQERGGPPSDKMDFPQLVKETCHVLELSPRDIDDAAKAVDTIRRVLGSLGSIVQGIAELRNQYGTGHGRAAEAKGLQPRHAKLAVGAATTIAVFLFETHQVRANTP